MIKARRGAAISTPAHFALHCCGVEHPRAAAVHLHLARSQAFSAKAGSAMLFSRDDPSHL